MIYCIHESEYTYYYADGPAAPFSGLTGTPVAGSEEEMKEELLARAAEWEKEQENGEG